MRKERTIPTVIGLVLLLAGVGISVLLVQRQQFFKLTAAPEITPKDVRITNVTDGGFTVSWMTDKETIGFVSFGDSTSLGQIAQDDQGTKSSPLHHVTISNLSTNTRYFFKIGSDRDTFDQDGKPWEQKTATQLSPRTADVISGTVKNSQGAPASDALVYVTLPQAAPLSTTTDSSGSFSLSLAPARTTNLSSYVTYDKNNALLSIFVQAGSGQVSSAQVAAASAHPVPPLILGQTHDFRRLSQTGEATSPGADLALPSAAPTASPESASSGFNLNPIASSSPAPSVDKLTIDNPKEGENISTKTPEFRGQGPKGVKVNLTLNSTTPITGTATVAANGTWTWTPPQTLTTGSHILIATLTDSKGQKQTTSRNFSVLAKAANLPAFTATGSAQASPGPTGASPSATPRVTASPSASPRASIIPTVAPRISMPSTESGVPVSGDLTNTIAVFILGITSIFGGALLFIKTRGNNYQ
ncbi:hypothetical protein HY404_02230 [Candidatus Microgenomates bacterium]|nr:hypothetical protein [Candidatus Microgenomates bacterium]